MYHAHSISSFKEIFANLHNDLTNTIQVDRMDLMICQLFSHYLQIRTMAFYIFSSFWVRNSFVIYNLQCI